ncbi:glycosyltransferase family 2 protein [Pontibacter ramchanderi]|uniref:Glycosyltransferase involved in cell wall biosynthesis n=1 Tax=Pontibacter ramchanderi TaxID=1179743 RepID=A0A2N3U904_9BACT|nr:glycosyltransferase family 2 protein [Pontibacter ramchanderi]PKV63221.1 glycosyltransferase involved in cell wall biosynthesis [Pontibacter ramchanderi]
MIYYTVVIPTFNRLSLLKEAIASVLNQSYSYFEIIVVDDCSSDETQAYFEKLKDSRIKYLRNKENSGAAYSRNTGILEAKGDFIVFLDSDNQLYPNFIEVFNRNILENSEASIFWCGVQHKWVKEGEVIRERHQLWQPDVTDLKFYLKTIRTSTGRGLVVRKSTCIQAGLFDPNLRTSEDTEFLLRVFQIAKFHVVPDVLYLSIIHEGYRLTLDYSNQAKSYNYIISKHKGFINDNIWYLARLLRKASYYNMLSGNLSMAKTIISNAIKANPLDFRNYYYLFKYLLKNG